MKTKKALDVLTRGEAKYAEHVSGPLVAHADRYLDAYNQRERAIVQAKNSDTVLQPIMDVLRRKTIALANSENRNTPIAMRFDAYQAIKAVAEASQDRGLVHLARHLEQSWHKDPMGSITLGEVADLRGHYTTIYPKSKIAKVMDKEIAKVGYQKLPIAKLTRLASRINSAEDYENLIVEANLHGDKPEQVKSRTLIRELVAMRGLEINTSEQASDDRSTIERLSDRIAQEMEMDNDIAADPLSEELSPELKLNQDIPEEPAGELPAEPVSEGEVDEVVPMIEDVEEYIKETAPPAAEPYIEVEQGEHSGLVPGTAEWGFAEAEEGHTAPPPSKEWQREELEEHGKNLDMLNHPVAAKKTAFTVTASEVEAALLDRGELVKVGQASIHINDQDEVEIWVRDAGMVTSIANLDVAINDFLRFAEEEVTPHISRRGCVSILELVPVPCAKCASVDYYESMQDGAFKCNCGYITKAASVNAMVDAGQLQRLYQLHVAFPDCDLVRGSVKAAATRLLAKSIRPYVKDASIINTDGSICEYELHGADKSAALGIVEHLVHGGMMAAQWEQFSSMRTAQLDSGSIKAPGSADAPINEINQPANITTGPDSASLADAESEGVQHNPDIAASFSHYKSTGLSFIEAIGQFKKDFSDWVERNSTPDLDAQLIGIGEQLYTGNARQAATGPEDVGEPADQPTDRIPLDDWWTNAIAGLPRDINADGVLDTIYNSGIVEDAYSNDVPWQEFAKELSEQLLGGRKVSFKDPSVNSQQPDAIKTKKPLGSESDSGHPKSLSQPKVITKHPAKQKSPTDMGGTNEEKDPGTFGASKPSKTGRQPGAGVQPGTKAPSKGMHGPDSDSDPTKSIPLPKK